MTCGTHLDIQPADTMMAKDSPFRLFDVTVGPCRPLQAGVIAPPAGKPFKGPLFSTEFSLPQAGFPYSSRCSFLPLW